MAEGKDESEDRRVRTNAGFVLKPPGLGLGGVAPSGAVGNQHTGMVGPLYLLWGDEHDHAPDRTADRKDAQIDKFIPRFPETPDPEVNRAYGADHVMVRTDGTEMAPSEWKDEKPKSEEDQRSISAEANDAFKDRGVEEPGDSMRPQLWEDIYRRDDDGIDR